MAHVDTDELFHIPLSLLMMQLQLVFASSQAPNPLEQLGPAETASLLDSGQQGAGKPALDLIQQSLKAVAQEQDQVGGAHAVHGLSGPGACSGWNMGCACWPNQTAYPHLTIQPFSHSACQRTHQLNQTISPQVIHDICDAHAMDIAASVAELHAMQADIQELAALLLEGNSTLQVGACVLRRWVGWRRQGWR